MTEQQINDNHKHSVNLWIESQKKCIDALKINIDYLTKDIDIKNQQLKNALESIEHEQKFLDDYIKMQEI